jgi:hypothetical protein
MDGDGQYIADAQFRVRLGGGLTIDADRTLRHETSAIRTSPQDAGAPQPFVQPLPVLVFDVGYRAPPLRRAARAANGPLADLAGGGASGLTGRRRNGSSIAGAGGPC